MRFFLAILTLWLATICTAQNVPLGIEIGKGSCDRSIGGSYGHPYRCYKVHYVNNSDKVIRGVKIAVDIVDPVGDKIGETILTCCTKWAMKLKPGKKEKVDYSYIGDERYANPRPLAVRFEDGTVWRSTEDEQRSD